MATILPTMVRATGLARMAQYMTEQAGIRQSLPGAHAQNEKEKTRALQQLTVHLQSLYRGGSDPTGNNNVYVTLASAVLALVGKDGEYAPSRDATRVLAMMTGAIDGNSVLVEIL